jgi:hypothetical protein
MEHEQRVIIQFLCEEHASPEDIHARLEAQFADTTYGKRSLRRWCQYVRQGREDLHNEVRSGRPPIGFLDIRILALLDERRFHSDYSITQTVGVSQSSVLNHLLESHGMKISFPLDPA